MAQKALCRLVQGGFRLALPLLPYREPKILNRVEQVAEARELYQWEGCRRPIAFGGGTAIGCGGTGHLSRQRTGGAERAAAGAPPNEQKETGAVLLQGRGLEVI